MLISGGLLLVAIGMVLLTAADASSSWTAVLPGTIVAGIAVGVAALGAMIPQEPRRAGRRAPRDPPHAVTRASSSTAIAALRPLRAITLPPGCVAAPHR
jgi:hypothetical protein